MADSLCRSVLDALTDVDMPKRHPARTAQGSIEADGLRLPVYVCDALVLGSGAAGWPAAVELKRYGIDVVVAMQNLCGGTSACSGPDKQTCMPPRPAGMAMISSRLPQPLALGATDEDTAYVEAVGSLRWLSSSDCRSRSIGWVRCSIKRIMTKPSARRVADPGPLD